MDRLSLKAEERAVLGKKVKKLRRDGKLPAHVFGKGVDGENVIVSAKDFLKTFHQAGETGLIDLKIGAEKVRPVLIRDVQYDPIEGQPIHIDFYQVSLTEKVKVPVPIELIGEQPEKVHLGEAIVLQTLNQVEVEALPTDLIEKLEVDISILKEIDDAIIVGQLNYDSAKLIIHAPEEEIVVKLAPAVSAEMEKLLEEEKAEAEAVQAEVPAEGEPASADSASVATLASSEPSAKHGSAKEAATAGEEGEVPTEAGEPAEKVPEEPKKE